MSMMPIRIGPPHVPSHVRWGVGFELNWLADMLRFQDRGTRLTSHEPGDLETGWDARMHSGHTLWVSCTPYCPRFKRPGGRRGGLEGGWQSNGNRRGRNAEWPT